MESYTFKHVDFAYSGEEKQALKDISFTIPQGQFVILCGPSGCGKTTLLRHLKSCMAPHGRLGGEIVYKGKPLEELSQREQAQEIGYVLQSPENQVVTDKVWHELAFGLESLGYDTPTIRRRVAEIAAFFGIENWFYKDVTELSGGQKQLLNLASIMAMQPGVLVLDEPTAQLDPIAAADFLALLGKINRELGITVILTEHRLEEAFPFAERVIVMKEGTIVCDGRPREVGIQLRDKGSGMFLAMPTAMRVWAGVETKLPCPLTVRDGTDFINERRKEQALLPLPDREIPAYPPEYTLQCQELWFRYEKDSADVVKGFSLGLQRGEFYALLGGNGAGKSTTLKVISGLRTAYRGKVKLEGRLGHLPQNPQTLFVKRTVREDLYEVFRGSALNREDRDGKVAQITELCGLREFLDRHTYDLSGGEQQRTALAKVLLTEPEILLLDEPTKGFDAEFKRCFGRILKQLLAQGVTILMVSHDVAFCAEHAHKCGLFFDGSIVAEGTPREFFSGNSFYTTTANRMARQWIPQGVTVEDLIGCCGGKLPQEEALPTVRPLPRVKETAVSFRPKPLPLWRKALAGLALAVALGVFFYVTGLTDLSKLVSSRGLSELGMKQLWLYLVLILSLGLFVLAVGRRSAPPLTVQTPVQKRKLSRRTMVAGGLILLVVPLTIFAGVVYLGNTHYNIVALLVLAECMLPFFLIFESRKPKARELVVISVLCAIAVAGRAAFFMLPQFKPVMAMVIISGVAFGGETGFLVGAVTMLASNVLFSQGPWTPWQMFSMGIIGFLAGVLFRKGLLRRSRGSLAAFGAFCALVIYGGIMNPASAVMYHPQNLNWKIILSYYVSGFPMDLVHGGATVIFLMLGAEPMLEKLDRIKEKYGLTEV
ncbi:MAG: ATP-binding cassette domain-containing protein [Oscillospiraceae bacterium]|nr:ATP-binding cassette domain-containing protein [Oscillospiraceae bacterium]